MNPRMRLPRLLILAAASILSGGLAAAQVRPGFPVPRIPYAPLHYLCYRAAAPIAVDGRLEEAAWEAAPWTAAFGDIEGSGRPAPPLLTRARMLWDDEYFYVAAQLEEPHLWATLTQRDAVIFRDHDFEVFIDPDGDTHQYYEFEMNALNTVWDLFLVRPYRDGGPAVDAWDIQGLRTAVRLDGTLGDPRDTDRGWTLEIAFPWAVLGQAAGRPAPPRDGDQWRVNFSRVEWDLVVAGNTYAKRTDPATGQPLPEHNWVWSPQGLIDMHYPEMWGIVQFAAVPAGGEAAFRPDPLEPDRWLLRQVYYAQRRHREERGEWARTAAELAPDGLFPEADWGRVGLWATPSGFEAAVTRPEGSLSIDQSGRLTGAP
jgi:hypothetical protein